LHISDVILLLCLEERHSFRFSLKQDIGDKIHKKNRKYLFSAQTKCIIINLKYDILFCTASQHQNDQSAAESPYHRIMTISEV